VFGGIQLKKLSYYLVVCAALLMTTAVVAQQPAAPVPSLILNAKTIFVSNNGDASGAFSGGADNLYNAFYDSLKNTNQFVMVADPSQADLVLETHFTDVQTVRLIIYDRKTRFVLWSLQQGGISGAFQKTRDRKFAAGIDALVQQFLQLAGKTGH
jgi:hypothetical protein